MSKFVILGLVSASLLLGSKIAFADERTPVEPQGAQRQVQYEKAVEICRKKYSGQYIGRGGIPLLRIGKLIMGRQVGIAPIKT